MRLATKFFRFGDEDAGKFKPNFPPSIDELFERVTKDSDQIAFKQVYDICFKDLCRFSYSIVGIKEEAEEIVNDVFFTIWSNRDHIQIVSSCKSYLLISVKNRSFDFLRRVKNRKLGTINEAIGDMLMHETPESNMIFRELSQHINQAVNLLPAQCKLIFMMSRDRGLKYREIASELSLSIKTIETQMGRALGSLRKSLATSYYV